MRAFRLKTKGLAPEGTICFPFGGYDYGLASDDTRATGREHRSFTLKTFGGPPSFTHPVDDLEEIEVPDIPPPDDVHAREVCKIGQGAECCKYLTMSVGSAGGWSCEKLSMLGASIALQKDMVARGDNCAGRASR